MQLKKIQARLRESIKNSSLTQKELARELRISPQTVSKYMKKDIFPALDTLSDLCKILDVSADYILCIKDY